MFELVDVRWRHPGDNPTQYKGWWDIWDTMDNTELCLLYLIKDRWHRAHSREGRANHPKFAFKKMPFPLYFDSLMHFKVQCAVLGWCLPCFSLHSLLSLVSQCLRPVSPCLSSLREHILSYLWLSVKFSECRFWKQLKFYYTYNTDELNGRPVYKHEEHDVIAISFLCLELESALVCCCKTLMSEALFLMDQVILG